MGCIAFVIDIIVETLVLWKWAVTQKIILNNMATGWANFTALSLLFSSVSAILTVYVGPGAAESGVAEMMAYLNGINYPKMVGFRTLVVKIVGVALAVSAGLTIGKEGPLAHIGMIIS